MLTALIAQAAIIISSTLATDLPAHVFDPATASNDERLYVVHDVDHPAPFSAQYLNQADWKRRADALRQQIRVAEGLWPEPVKTPLNPVIHGRIERDGYTIEKVYFASLPGHYVSGNLYRPTGRSGMLPVVLCPHGHWANGRLYEAPDAEVKKQLEMGAEKTAEGARYPMQARCAGLARMGCIVFMYDMIGYADSQAIAHRVGFTDVDAVLRLQSFMGLQTWNSIRALDFVTSLPDVDPRRIAVTGASGGATQTLILAALDDRVSVCFPAVMVSTAMQGGCICENSPLLRVDTNNAEIAALFAPKPLGMTAANDWTIELPYRGFPEIREIYKLYGAVDNVAAWHRSFPHNYNQVSRELMYEWMNTHLHLEQPEPTLEKPFVPVPPAELSVFDQAHPRPTDELDAVALRKNMTTASEAQLAKLAKNPAEYRRVIGSALNAIVGDHLPAAGDVMVGNGSGVVAMPDGVTLEKGTIRRKNAQAAVPFATLTPQQWNGCVILWLDPAGRASLFDERGTLTDPARHILDAKAAILAPDLLDIGEHRTAANVERKFAGKYAGYTYPGYYFGYNRPLLAERASDILSAIALARGWQGTRSVRIVAFGKTGLAALLAEALAGDAVDRAVLDLNAADFDQIRDPADEMLLPGALKYGGIAGMLLLCSAHHTAIWNAPVDGELQLLKSESISIVGDRQSIDWAIRQVCQ